ncbi:hypothetical protein B5P44_01110 [Mycobacterium sp. CBMA 213]|uniref:HAD family hydrolase n=2 Tax=unclassified Mycolicibacterium TaxID=2636767 RepID=A0A343VRL5_9MYCO|nr:HAD family hydrolase [Mycolicibacterium sp. CBMA 213]AVN58539.1 hypothetical protein B5P44_p00244 [Mycolicibacterium sp. CBMA 213]MUM03420.1 hypothetical protein [Mycolicibacterium sp. CBMA 213]
MFAVDLDRTMIYSKRWFSEADYATAVCVERRDGAEVSFMTATAAHALTLLNSRHPVVPATARTVAQYGRITLPGGPYRFAVTTNGGVILVDEQPDPVWEATVAAAIRAESAVLDEVLQALQARISDEWVRKVVVADDCFVYCVVDESKLPTDFVESWHHWCQLRGWQVTRQDQTIYTVPRPLCKSHAVLEIKRRLESTGELAVAAPFIAAGDGALDAGLLATASVAIVPAHSGLRPGGATVTAAHGARAAEEILALCLVQHRAGVS